MNLYEIIGYSGSVIVAVSLMMKNIRHLRNVNLIGSSTFAIYGLLLKAYPVFLLNGFIAIVDIYYLYEMNKKEDYFSLMPVLDKNHPYLNKFLDYYKNDILKYFPNFTKDEIKGASCFFILRNLLPVGLFIYREMSSDKIEVLIDYAIPDYRDTKNGKYVYYTESNFLKEKGFKEIIAKTSIAKHQDYLKKIGFKMDIAKANLFVKKIDL
jgi:hypothetical protein